LISQKTYLLCNQLGRPDKLPEHFVQAKKMIGAVAKTDARVCNLIGSRTRIAKIECIEQRVIC
jgi:hypothetical protein